MSPTTGNRSGDLGKRHNIWLYLIADKSAPGEPQSYSLTLHNLEPEPIRLRIGFVGVVDTAVAEIVVAILRHFSDNGG
jgi:hypothetical protein